MCILVYLFTPEGTISREDHPRESVQKISLPFQSGYYSCSWNNKTSTTKTKKNCFTILFGKKIQYVWTWFGVFFSKEKKNHEWHLSSVNIVPLRDVTTRGEVNSSSQCYRLEANDSCPFARVCGNTSWFPVTPTSWLCLRPHMPQQPNVVDLPPPSLPPHVNQNGLKTPL